MRIQMKKTKRKGQHQSNKRNFSDHGPLNRTSLGKYIRAVQRKVEKQQKALRKFKTAVICVSAALVLTTLVAIGLGGCAWNEGKGIRKPEIKAMCASVCGVQEKLACKTSWTKAADWIEVLPYLSCYDQCVKKNDYSFIVDIACVAEVETCDDLALCVK
jgi:hypothetical protein